MYVEVHRGPPGPLLDGWAALHAAQPTATPFMSPAWGDAWWRHYGTEAKPLVVCVREDGRLTGLAPLVVRKRGPLRVLEAWGIEPGDYWDVLGGEAAADAVARALRDTGGWDAWILRCLPPESPLVAALDRAGLPALVHEATPAPAIELPDDFDAYLATLSSNHRSNLRKHLRRLDNEIVLREVQTADLPAAFGRWRDFRRRQWEAQGKEIDPDHLSTRFHDFLLDCVRDLLPSGRALVWEFEHEGEIVGTYVNFADDEAFHWYLGGFDPAVAKLGLGKIAIGHGIRTSIAAGRRRFDFGRGAEDYKYWYGAVDRHLPARVVARPGLRGRAALTAAGFAIARRT
jgi:CelD/BcsL family acetyltransferase involved in cellulose biosynthesis